MDVYDALLDGYDIESLKRLILFHFRDEYDGIDWTGNMQTVAAGVVAKAHDRGWTDGLVGAMKADNPNNPKVKALPSSKRAIEGMNDDAKLERIYIVLFGVKEASQKGFVDRTEEKLQDIDKRLGKIEKRMPFGSSDIFTKILLVSILATSILSLLWGA